MSRDGGDDVQLAVVPQALRQVHAAGHTRVAHDAGPDGIGNVGALNGGDDVHHNVRKRVLVKLAVQAFLQDGNVLLQRIEHRLIPLDQLVLEVIGGQVAVYQAAQGGVDVRDQLLLKERVVGQVKADRLGHAGQKDPDDHLDIHAAPILLFLLAPDDPIDQIGGIADLRIGEKYPGDAGKPLRQIVGEIGAFGRRCLHPVRIGLDRKPLADSGHGHQQGHREFGIAEPVQLQEMLMQPGRYHRLGCRQGVQPEILHHPGIQPRLGRVGSGDVQPVAQCVDDQVPAEILRDLRAVAPPGGNEGDAVFFKLLHHALHVVCAGLLAGPQLVRDLGGGDLRGADHQQIYGGDPLLLRQGVLIAPQIPEDRQDLLPRFLRDGKIQLPVVGHGDQGEIVFVQKIVDSGNIIPNGTNADIHLLRQGRIGKRSSGWSQKEVQKLIVFRIHMLTPISFFRL